MLRRFLIVLLPLAGLLVAALGVPLAATIAQRETQDTYVDRLNDVGRFASLAETALQRGRTEALEQELRRYHELYRTPVALLDPGGQLVLGAGVQSADNGIALIDAAHRNASDHSTRPTSTETPESRLSSAHRTLGLALAGHRPEPPRSYWPWSDEPMVIAEPIGRDGELVGVVVAVAPTDRLTATITSAWRRLALLGLAPAAGLIAVTWPVSRWVLRPVRRLDEATATVADGDLTTRVGTGRGPPELRRLASSFNVMVDVVERALNRQRAFVSDASHQLRNPLASLRLAVENLAPFLTSAKALEAHQMALEEARAMNRLLNSLLVATRLDSIRRAEPVDLDTLLTTRTERWRVLAGQHRIRLTVDVPAGLRLLEPPGGLGSVLDELLSNAFRLSGGSRVELAATRSGDGDLVDLRVADDGTGLDPDDRLAALGRFWRAPAHQNTPGSGLGLAICAESVAAAGGELTLASGLPHASGNGTGLAVVIRLPHLRDDR